MKRKGNFETPTLNAVVRHYPAPHRAFPPARRHAAPRRTHPVRRDRPRRHREADVSAPRHRVPGSLAGLPRALPRRAHLRRAGRGVHHGPEPDADLRRPVGRTRPAGLGRRAGGVHASLHARGARERQDVRLVPRLGGLVRRRVPLRQRHVPGGGPLLPGRRAPPGVRRHAGRVRRDPAAQETQVCPHHPLPGLRGRAAGNQARALPPGRRAEPT
mmetsp:Transcript_20264/g.51872  ORF Transcript_20264/g.51872 Transcript_20264/m.51872 type:complete len:215 (-) Transcript_20264:607-1251(-)